MFGNYLTITISNPTNNPGKWVAFGYNEGLQNSTGVSVKVSESSADQATRESANNPFVITEIKVQASSSAQMDNPVIIRNSEMTGSGGEDQFIPSDYADTENKSPNFIKIADPKIQIKGPTTIEGTINAKSTMTLTLQIKPLTKMSSFVDSVLSLFQPGTKLSVTGLPAR